jgi:PAS domain-containing protein
MRVVFFGHGKMNEGLLQHGVDLFLHPVELDRKPITGVEVRGQRADKLNADHIWITHWHPLKGPKGNIIGANVVAEDITERKRAEAVLAGSEKALRESEARFRELADNISQFAWTADQEGWIYWYNKRWHDYTGTTLEEMQGCGWQKVHHPEHVDRVVHRIKQSFETGTPWEDTLPLVVATVAIAGSSRALCPSATRPAM